MQRCPQERIRIAEQIRAHISARQRPTKSGVEDDPAALARRSERPVHQLRLVSVDFAILEAVEQ